MKKNDNVIENIRTLGIGTLAKLALQEMAKSKKDGMLEVANYSASILADTPGESLDEEICLDGTRGEMMEAFIAQTKGVWDSPLAVAIRDEFQRRLGGGTIETGQVDTGNTAPKTRRKVAAHHVRKAVKSSVKKPRKVHPESDLTPTEEQVVRYLMMVDGFTRNDAVLAIQSANETGMPLSFLDPNLGTPGSFGELGSDSAADLADGVGRPLNEDEQDGDFDSGTPVPDEALVEQLK